MRYAALLILLSSFNTTATFAGDAEKPFSIGIGTYSSIIAYDNSLYEDDELSGFSLSFAYAVSDMLAFRGTYFSLEHNDFSDIESTGYDLLAHLGTGLATHGFKAYIGGGLFSDKWESGAFSKTFNGLQLSGGIGYNWDSVSLDFILGIRDASDYEAFINENLPTDVSAVAASGSLLLSYRF